MDKRSIEHGFDTFPTLEATVSTMTIRSIPTTRSTERAMPATTRAPRAVPGAAALRLTRRGRWVLGVAIAILAVAAVLTGVLLGGGAAAAGERAIPVAARIHVVLPGETLWQIALAADPRSDPRDTVARIIELNQLPSALLAVGAKLQLPPVS